VLRNRGLDILRAVTILLVLGRHNNGPSSWQSVGWVGVRRISGLLEPSRRVDHCAVNADIVPYTEVARQRRLRFARGYLKPRPYDASYYVSEGPASSLRSARIVVPALVSLLQPRSVIDVGCGSGAWLSAFRENGVERILGLDGDHVDRSWLIIPKDCFRAVNLAKPFKVDEKFDLAMSLEVAEHLPEKHARDFVRNLVSLAPFVVFSAAVPFQGGIHHLNEQWPEFWQDLFAESGYRSMDLIRKQFWKNAGVKYWYRQNMFLFAREDMIPANPALLEASSDADDLMLVQSAILHYQMGVRSILKQLPRSIWSAVSRRLKRIPK
jgi:SAM-dependent methyltransferase